MLHPHVQVDDPWLDAEDDLQEAQDGHEPEDEGEQPTLSFQVPRAFQPLLKPSRYKAARGGRGSGKSHRFAEQLIDKAIRKYEVTGGEEGLRWACLREVQKSLEQSAMRLIKDKVMKYGLTDLFDISKKDVIVPPGKDGLIIFQGMQNHTADSIKSLEGYDGGWFEEAHRASEYSLSLLRPTFRKDPDPKTGFEGSELWFSYNPEDPKDPIEKFFFGEEPKIRRDPKNPSLLLSLPFDSIVVEANWYDNPWLPQVLVQEKDYDKRRDPDRYAHVWLGKYKRFSEARVFRNWKIAELPNPPADVRLYFGADWGYSVDPTVLVRLWVDQEHRRIYIDHEAYQVGCEINNIPALFEKVPGSRDWPIRADSSRPDTISYVGNVGGFQITPALKGPSSVEDGIEFMKSYDIVVDPRCKHVIDELSYYSWKVDKKTEEILPVLEDKNNHVIDSARYALESVRGGGVSMMDYL